MSGQGKTWGRGFQFSLGSFILVTSLVGALIGSVLSKVRERDRAVAFFISQGGSVNTRQPLDAKSNLKPLPFMLSLVGARAYNFIIVPESIYHSKEPGEYRGFSGYLNAEALFPESRIVVRAEPQDDD